MAYSVNPQLLQAIRTKVPRALQPILLATALVESGGRLNAVGDQGHSYGPYQEYDQGRGHGLTPAQRMDPYGSTTRALRDFAPLYQRGVRGGELAYEAQRPADHAGYVAKINAALPVAQKILGSGAAAAAPSSPAPAAPGARELTPVSGSLDVRRLMALLNVQRQRVLAGQMPAPNYQRQLASLVTGSYQGAKVKTTGQVVGAQVAGAGRNVAGAVGRAVAGSEKIIGTPYSGTHTLGNWESDNAVDIAAPVGSPVYALADGVIGQQFGSLGKSGRFAGLRLHLQTKGNEFYYAHLSRFAPGIKPGARVRRGQIIGYSGEANGVGHLHLGVRSGDPRRFLQT